MTQEALRMALEALENYDGQTWEQTKETITDIKEALAQPEQEPVGYVQTVIEALYENGDPISVDAAELLQRISSQPEQEPVAWVAPTTLHDLKIGVEGVHLVYETEMVNSLPLYEKPQRTEQNFCPRCGKRNKDIHTCTPPQEGT